MINGSIFCDTFVLSLSVYMPDPETLQSSRAVKTGNTFSSRSDELEIYRQVAGTT